jgi:hypothetical protein
MLKFYDFCRQKIIASKYSLLFFAFWQKFAQKNSWCP